MARFVRLGAAILLFAAGAVSCTPAPGASPVFCAGSKATMVVDAASAPIVNGTAGPDVIAVVGGVHEVRGGAGNDTICGDLAGSTLIGGDGNDRLFGTAAAERLDGGNGDDLLQGGGGPDNLIGGPGTDTVSYADHSAPVTASLDGKADNGSTGENDRIDGTVENLTGGSGNDTLTGNAGANLLAGGSGADRLQGAAGNDILEGQDGNDALSGQSGKDTKDGGAGSNFCDVDNADAAASGCTYDPNRPVAHSIQVKTPHLDFLTGERTVLFEVDAGDTGTGGGGIWSAAAAVCGPDGKADGTSSVPLFLMSGSPHAGVWQGEQILPDDAPSGTWQVCGINLLDIDANYVEYASTAPAGSHALPMPSGTLNFDVANDSGDYKAPVISGLTITPSVDVTSHDATVTVDFSVAEEGSGVNEAYVDLRHYNDTQTDTQTHLVHPPLITPSAVGASGSGRYRATIVLPEGSAAGRWFANVRVWDRVSNLAEAMQDMMVTDRNPITDVPHLVDGDVTAGPTASTRTIRLHFKSVRDQLSGVGVVVTDPTGRLVGSDSELSTGTDLDGTWVMTVDVPSDAVGTWAITDGGTTDRLGVTRPLTATDLSVVAGRTWTVG